MASTRGRPHSALIDLLREEPYRFDSRQALRVLETRQRLASASPAPRPAAPVAFRSSLSLQFPVSDIESVSIPADLARPPVVTVSFLGLGGAMGPLPTPYTEYLNASLRRGELAGRDFLDLFNHRLVTSSMNLAKLFRPALQPGPPQRSNIADQLFALLGLGTPGLRTDSAHATPMRKAMVALAPALLPLTALINQRPLSVHAIERAVETHFKVRTRVIQFRGAWLAVPGVQCSRIGESGRNRRLGQDAMLGDRAWEQAANITLELGPLALDRAEHFLPPAAAGPETAHGTLAALLDFMLEPTTGVGVRLVVDPVTLRPSRLSRAQPLRLGWTTWLGCERLATRDEGRLGRAVIALRRSRAASGR